MSEEIKIIRKKKTHIGSWSERQQNVTPTMGAGVCALTHAARDYSLGGRTGAGVGELN